MTEKQKRAKRLREIMTAHNLDAQAVGKMLGRSPQTVRVWRCRNPSRPIPTNELRLLEKLAAEKTSSRADE